MKTKFIALALILISSVLLAGCELSSTSDSPEPVAEAETSLTPEQLIEKEAYEHGCVLEEGFTWCNDKQKCLKEDEEPCEPNPDIKPPKRNYNLIEESLAVERGISVNDFVLGINKLTLAHFRGIIKDEDGIILAAKRNNDWVIVFDGNGAYSCSDSEPYNFPKDMISDCVSD